MYHPRPRRENLRTGRVRRPAIQHRPDAAGVGSAADLDRVRAVLAEMQAPIPFTRREDTLFALAALTDGCSIIRVLPNALLITLHARMKNVLGRFHSAPCILHSSLGTAFRKMRARRVPLSVEDTS